MNVLVTGGSGFLGKRLKIYKPEWNYISSKDCDLTDKNEVRELFNDIKPEAIIHLAARVGGIKDKISCPPSTNMSINSSTFRFNPKTIIFIII